MLLMVVYGRISKNTNTSLCEGVLGAAVLGAWLFVLRAWLVVPRAAVFGAL